MSNAHLVQFIIIFCDLLIEWVCLFTLKWKAQSGNWVHVNQKQYKQIINLAQDISHSVRRIPSKNVLVQHVLKWTRSKTTVPLLNRFRNCISDQDAQRYIATITASVDVQNGVFIPTNLKPGHFKQFAFHNLDFCLSKSKIH